MFFLLQIAKISEPELTKLNFYLYADRKLRSVWRYSSVSLVSKVENDCVNALLCLKIRHCRTDKMSLIVVSLVHFDTGFHSLTLSISRLRFKHSVLLLSITYFIYAFWNGFGLLAHCIMHCLLSHITYTISNKSARWMDYTAKMKRQNSLSVLLHSVCMVHMCKVFIYNVVDCYGAKR